MAIEAARPLVTYTSLTVVMPRHPFGVVHIVGRLRKAVDKGLS